MITYMCENCFEQNTEWESYIRPYEIFIAPTGKWLCEGCFEEMHPDLDIRLAEHPKNPFKELELLRQKLKEEGRFI